MLRCKFGKCNIKFSSYNLYKSLSKVGVGDRNKFLNEKIEMEKL